jgi:hypothetical protein
MLGRPTIYTKELGTEICRRIAEGESLRKICREDGMPVVSTVMLWVLDTDKPDFSEQYTRACNARAEILFEDVLEFADTSVEDIVGDDKSDGARVQARKLQTDARKWYLSKVLPKKYGDKLDVTSGDRPISILNVLSNDGDKKDTETK